MKEHKFNIKDESQDRKYFSIVPHFVTNHSTLAERGFYLTLKRITGEYGTVRYSARDLGKMCGISDDTVYRLLDSLIKRGWIKEAGKIPTGHKPRRTYSIVDLWKQNIDFYTKKTENRPGAVNEDKVAPERDIKPQTKDTEEEPVKEEINTSETLPHGKSQQVGANKKENSRCPLLLKDKYPNLAEKYPGGHGECVEFINSIEEEFKTGRRFVNYGKQFGALHKILRAGYSFEEINDCIVRMEENNFWREKGWDFGDVANVIGKRGTQYGKSG